MSAGVCEHQRQNRDDRVLGKFATAEECHLACQEYWDPLDIKALEMKHPRVREGVAVTCNTWTFMDSSVCVGHLNSALFNPGWEPERTVHGLATCAPPAVVRRHTSSQQRHKLLVLQTVASFAVKPSVVRRLANAHAQITFGSPYRTVSHVHRVIQVSRRDAMQPLAHHVQEDTQAMSALKLALGDENSISLVGAAEIAQAFPKLLKQTGSIKWSDEREPRWLSNGCDLPALAWWAIHADQLPTGVTQVWVIQHDVGWTGHLPAVLQKFESGADLLCEGLAKVIPTWYHIDAHNHLHGVDKYACQLPIVRYSTRLMNDQVSSLRAGNHSYCEMRAPTVCANSQWGCRSADTRASGLLGTFTWFTSVEESALIATGSSSSTNRLIRCAPHARGDGSSVGRLYHRVYNKAEEYPSRDCPMLCGTYLPTVPEHSMCPDLSPAPCFSGIEQCCVNPWTHFDTHKFVPAAANAALPY
jgi:hypothetical protein